MRALMPLMFQVAIFMAGWRYRSWAFHAVTPQNAEALVAWIAGWSPAMTRLVEKLDREAGAAAARGGDVRIVELELRPDQIVHEVEFGA
jgi:hypothetical protein